MVTNYTINIVNESASAQTFWCFLAPPDELASDPGVFANSAANLQVLPNSPNSNTFTIPVQFVVGAGASNRAVGLNVKVQSSITQDTDLGQMWSATYVNVPPNQGPSLTTAGSVPNPKQIGIMSNPFDQVSNENQSWFSSMSFGINTESGFMGLTWSPSPHVTRILTPKLKFFVATGSYGENQLAKWTDISTTSAVISVPDDFQYGQTTVTLDASGNWQVTKGKPSLARGEDRVDLMLRSHLLLAEAHAKLVPLAGALGETQTDTVASVKWNSSLEDPAAGITLLTGTLTVTTALAAAFSAFVLSGVNFSITSAPAGGFTIHFSYSGPLSVQAVKDLLVAGAQLFLRS